MPKDTKTLGNNKARACESLGFVHKKRLCQRFDTTSIILTINLLLFRFYKMKLISINPCHCCIPVPFIFTQNFRCFFLQLLSVF